MNRTSAVDRLDLLHFFPFFFKVNASVTPEEDAKRDTETGEPAAEGGDGERWISGAELEGFKGDWMALARRRTGRTASGLSAAAAASAPAKGRRGGDARDVSPVANRPSMALQANVRDERAYLWLCFVSQVLASYSSTSISLFISPQILSIVLDAVVYI